MGPCHGLDGIGYANITGEKVKLLLCHQAKKSRASIRQHRIKTALYCTVRKINYMSSDLHERKQRVHCMARPGIPSGISFASAVSPASSAHAPAPNDLVSLANSQPKITHRQM